MAWPCSLRIDSGWNCTPSIASPRWRKPMISPSSVCAVTSRVGRQRGAFDGQRVVADDVEAFGKAPEHTEPVGADRAGLAVHLHLRPHDLAAQRRADRLVAQADAEQRQLAGEVADGLDADARLGRRAGAGRQHQMVGPQVGDALHRDLVIAEHAHVLAEFTEVLHQVVGEAVVVVDHQQHDQNPSSTSSAARISARALCSVSLHSISGTESATTPAAACTYSVWSLTMPVRMAMATSMSPAKLR